MNEHVNPAAADIATVVANNPVLVLTDAKTYSAFYEHIKGEVAAFKPDLTTDKGRKEIASLAYKVTRTKTAIDAAGKELNEEARARINVVDAQRRKIREELDELTATVRKPLTEWEDREEERKQTVAAMLEQLAGVEPSVWDGTAEIQAALDKLLPLTFEEAVYQDELPRVEHAHKAAIAMLERELARSKQADADREELAQLRAANAAREANEAAEREATAAAEREKVAAEEKAAADAREAEEAKRREEEAVEAARQEEQRKAAAAIKAAEDEKQAIVDAQKKAESDRQAEANRLAEEQAAREADKAHRNKVVEEAVDALMEAGGIGTLKAHAIVLSIVAGQIPHVTLRF